MQPGRNQYEKKREGVRREPRKDHDRVRTTVTNVQDTPASKTQMNYKYESFGRSGWFYQSLNENIKIDFNLVHDPGNDYFLVFWASAAQWGIPGFGAHGCESPIPKGPRGSDLTRLDRTRADGDQ